MAMTGKIYHIQTDESLQALDEQAYDSEDLLQRLLEHYPDLLAGDQIDPDNPRRWLLVDREVGVPDADDAGDRWSLDHLFLDQDGIPTLVEVKRSSDTRTRREVVGQMLDYAANAVVYWPADAIRTKFEVACETRGDDPNALITTLLESPEGGEGDVDAYWSQVKTNLQAGKVRMIFVADRVPVELRRIVEFLNGQMDPAQVLAIELRQYVGGGIRTLVPQVLGLTAAAQQKKATGQRETRQWDEASFFEEMERRSGPSAAAVARHILVWAGTHMPDIWWGRGRQMGSFVPGITINGRWHQLFGVWTYGTVEVQFQYMKSRGSLDESQRTELLRRLNEIAGVSLPSGSINLRPAIPLSVIEDDFSLSHFLGAMEWAADQVVSHVHRQAEPE